MKSKKPARACPARAFSFQLVNFVAHNAVSRDNIVSDYSGTLRFHHRPRA
jgi:hypothetical protein